MHFSTLNINALQFHIHIMFINNDGMQFCIIYHNLNNNIVCARFAHLHCQLQFNCSIILKLITI
jgi:competence transcription factor ComK